MQYVDARVRKLAVNIPRGASLTEGTGVSETRIIGLRRKFAEKMQETKRRIPHMAYIEGIDVTELEARRRYVNVHKAPAQPKLTLLPFFIRTSVRALPDFPQMNTHFYDDRGVLHKHDGVHVGIAAQTPGGLMVLMLRHKERRDVRGLATELRRLAAAARAGTASREEVPGSTITLTPLGPLGRIATTPVINRPQVAIIAPNKIVDRLVSVANTFTVPKFMKLSSLFDYRIIDGYDAARFVQRMKRPTEHPALFFMN